MSLERCNAVVVARIAIRATLIAASLCVQAAARSADDSPIVPSAVVPLFNGKDLSGWQTWLADTKRDDPRGVFAVKDGQLRISGDGFGHLATDKSYRDYRLIVEFQWGAKSHASRKGKARDSGVWLHSEAASGDEADRTGIECQIKQGAVGDLILPSGGDPKAWRDKDAAWQDARDFRGPRDLESRPREWTRLECVCRGDRLAVYVGGTLVNELTGLPRSAGPICLRCEGSEVLFRRVELHPLSAAAEGEPLAEYRVQNVAGWTVHVNRSLLAKEKLARETLDLLAAKLHDVRRMVRPKALAELEKIPFWLELADPRHPCACYHISPEWLAAHGFSVDKAGAVEIANAENFLSWTKQQPWMVLHELTHGYHDRVLTHGHAPLRACYEQAMKDKRYDAILDFAGNRRRAYAANNVEEYFAEATEAFFGTNDFYPFVRPELREHDPELYKVLERIWGE